MAMNRKSFLKRLERTLRIPAPGRNSFMATIEDAEFVRRQSSGPTLFDPEGTFQSATALPTEPTQNVDNASHRFIDEGVRIGASTEESEAFEYLPAIADEASTPILPFSMGDELVREVPPSIEPEIDFEPIPQMAATVGTNDAQDGPLFDPSIIEIIRNDIGASTTFTIGLISLSKSPLSELCLTRFVDQLALATKRTTHCIRVSGESQGMESHPVTPAGEEGIHTFFESWDLGSKLSYGKSLQSGLRQIPGLKSRYPLVVIDIGACEQPWVEPLGRLCDSVYLVLPLRGALSPSRATRKAQSLMRAQVPVRGSWLAAVA